MRFEDWWKYNSVDDQPDAAVPHILHLSDLEEQWGSDWYDRQAPAWESFEGGETEPPVMGYEEDGEICKSLNFE